MNKKLYLASPFFNEKQIALRDAIYELTTGMGFEVYSPGHQNLITKDSDQKTMKNAFKTNLLEITNCDFVLAIGNEYDTGTMVEIGYAFAKGVPVVYFNDSHDGKARNLMIAGASFMSADSIEKLANILSLVDNQSEICE